jgi:hypothetical protein
VDPRAVLDADVERRKISCPYRDSDPSAVEPVASRYTDCAIPAPRLGYYEAQFKLKINDTDVCMHFHLLPFLVSCSFQNQ